MTSPSPQPNEVYVTFCGQITQDSVQNLFHGFATAMANRVPHIHLLLQSTGGFVGDGVALYNYFRTLPVDLTVYNVGTVASIATIAYLGAKRRKVSTHAAFMIHRTFRQELATAARSKTTAQSLTIEDQRTEAIIREYVTLPPEQWTEFNYHDLMFSAAEAVEIGIADEIGEFAPPFGTQLFSLSMTRPLPT